MTNEIEKCECNDCECEDKNFVQNEGTQLKFDNFTTESFSENYYSDVIYTLSSLPLIKRDAIFQFNRLRKMIKSNGGFYGNPDLVQAYDCFINLELIIKKKLNILETETIAISRELELESKTSTQVGKVGNDVFKEHFNAIESCVKYFVGLTSQLKDFRISNSFNRLDALYEIAKFVTNLFEL